MKIRDLIRKYPPIKIKKLEYYELSGSVFNKAPELEYLCSMFFELDEEWDEIFPSIEEHVLVEHHFDARRYWKLSLIYFDDKPIALQQRAGREGEDHSEDFVCDVEAFDACVQYIINTLKNYGKVESFPEHSIVRLDEDANLTQFYGYSIDDFSKRQ